MNAGILICWKLWSNSRYKMFDIINVWFSVRCWCLSVIEAAMSSNEEDGRIPHMARHGRNDHLVVCLTTGPKPLPKRALHIVRSRASSFRWEYPLLSLRSSKSFVRLLPCLPVTSIPPCIFPSVTRCRRQFLRKMWPVQFAFRLRISCRIFLCSLTLSNTSSFLTWSV
jgi:hypothetical protein